MDYLQNVYWVMLYSLTAIHYFLFRYHHDWHVQGSWSNRFLCQFQQLKRSFSFYLVMGKVRKRQKKFNYDKNRKKAWKKSKKLPSIQCKQMKNAWDEKKSITQNLSDMGISADPNRSVPIPKAKDFILTNKGVGKMAINEGGSKKKSRKTKLNVIKELEAEASTPQPHTLKFSEPEVRFCIYMMEKYREDYKKMARDERNYYQETPKQIRRKILTFKNIPEQYNAYLKSKKQEMDTT